MTVGVAVAERVGLSAYPEYRDSGVSWLGQIPVQWDVRRIKTIFRIVAGTTPSSTESRYWGGDVVWVTPRDFGPSLLKSSARRITEVALSECSLELVPSGSIVITCRAPVGNVALAAIPLCTNQGCKALLPNDAVMLPRFAYRVAQAMKSEFERAANGTTFVEVSAADVANLWFPIPPLAEQAAIVRFLDDADVRIRRYVAAKKKAVALLNEQKRSIVQQAITRGFDAGLSLRASGVRWLGDVPAHWEVARLKARLVRNDSGAWGSDFAESGTVVLRSTEQTIAGEWRITAPARRLLTDAERKATLLRAGDLVVTKSSGSSAHIGKTSLVTDEVERMQVGFSNFMQRLRPAADTNPQFLWFVLNSPLARNQLVYQATATTGLGNLNGTVLGNVWVAFPPREEQDQICSQTDAAIGPLVQAIGLIEHEVSLAQEYRSRLVADATTGRLDVRPAAEGLPDGRDAMEALDEADSLSSVEESDTPEANVSAEDEGIA